jgi:N,N'-diacetyllegionaminate synthase
MVETIKIESRLVGEGWPCFVIAEAGSNHNGNLEQAMRLIDVAVEAGADAVKFQLFRASKLYPKNAGQSDYLKLDESIYDIMSAMEMPYEWLPELAEHCRQSEIIFLASAFDQESVDQLDPYVSAYKIASYEMTHLPLVRYIAGKGKPVIISTGTASQEEVAETVEVFFETGNRDLMLMQCTASYPAPVESLNLRAITTLRNAFQVPVGFSDHSLSPVVGPLAAVALGTDLVEKHFTLSTQLPGPDHAFSLEPDELTLMIRSIREVELSLGSGVKETQPVEEELRGFARRSVFAIKDISAGDSLTPNNIDVLRSGNLEPGLAPKYYDEILGNKANRDIQAGSAIQREDYA